MLQNSGLSLPKGTHLAEDLMVCEVCLIMIGIDEIPDVCNSAGSNPASITILRGINMTSKAKKKEPKKIRLIRGMKFFSGEREYIFLETTKKHTRVINYNSMLDQLNWKITHAVITKKGYEV